MPKEAFLRLLGVEDGSFKAFQRRGGSLTYLVGVVMESNRVLDVKAARIEVDGLDATDRLLEMCEGTDDDAVLLGGITFAGFNVIDPWRVHEALGAPIIVVSRVRPSDDDMLEALKKHFEDWRQRWEPIERLGTAHECTTFLGEPPIFYEVVGCDREWAEETLKGASLISRIPEPVRVAGIVARGLS